MADNTITILDENGGTVQNKIYFQKADNGSGWIHKNHSGDVDYGMQIRDLDDQSNSATLQISGELQQANLLLQRAGDASASKYTIYHTGNKPTTQDIGAVAKTGDTMTGTLEIENSTYPILKLHNTTSDSACTISGNPNATYIASYNVDNDNNNFRTLVIADSTAYPDVKDSLRMIDRVNGESTYYKIYGTHNKPTPGEIGAIPASGGVLGGTLTVKTNDTNGYGLINKNHSATADYGMQFRDISSSNQIATLIVSAANQKASLSLKPSADATASTYELYHEGNKPTPTEIGAAPAYTYGTTDLVAGSSTLTTGKLHFVYK